MLIQQILLGLFALGVPTLGLVVLMRLLWSAWQAVRASRIKHAALAVLASACLVALFGVVAVIWFGYALAHSAKDGWSDLAVVALTGLPYGAACYALWRLAGRIRSAPGAQATPPGVAAAPPPAARR
jgi:hypothetical protein